MLTGNVNVLQCSIPESQVSNRSIDLVVQAVLVTDTSSTQTTQAWRN